ncbi:MAG TPA: histidine kinase [Blastocatellia bacterium]|nr:histidine kinase [Blastocatellia bacterium]
MNPNAYATLVNSLGFITGGVLYGMLLVMVLKVTRDTFAFGSSAVSSRPSSDRLPLITAILGLAWTIITFAAYGLPNLGIEKSMPLLVAIGFSALGFLPAVVVHSVLRTGAPIRGRGSAALIIGSAYALSAITSAMHLIAAVTLGQAESHSALIALTLGFVVLIVTLLFLTRREEGWRRAVWVVALSLFAVSALHLSHHVGQDYPWWIELVGHHASVPLVLAILYQDYRFALADLFLKRALSLVFLVAVVFGLYATLASHIFSSKAIGGDSDTKDVGVLLAMWVATAMFYPVLRRAVDRFVDRLVLRRADYEELRIDLAQVITTSEDTGKMLDHVCDRLAKALTAREVRAVALDELDDASGRRDGIHAGPVNPHRPGQGSGLDAGLTPTIHLFRDLRDTTDNRPGWSRTTGAVAVPTVDPPQYALLIGELAGGRRLLSDDIAMLEAVAILLARRIDMIRVTHERCERDLREQEVSKLATEAQLRALRAQINPHFLFNALTTIGYLIQTSPDRALDALMRLTGLLRGALQRSRGEFATLGQEMDLIEAYLDIERARFEDRLRVTIDVPLSERSLRVPAFLVQPLVENAVKHGISPCKAGGEITVAAHRAAAVLHISVRDTGAGSDRAGLEDGRRYGVGLANVEQRLKCHYGQAASLNIASEPGVGTTVDIMLPVNSAGERLAEAELAGGVSTSRV